MIKHHALPARLFVGRGPFGDKYDRVYKLHELPQLAEDLTARTGVVLEQRRMNASSQQVSVLDLAPKTQSALRLFPEAEYSDLAGYYDNPLA